MIWEFQKTDPHISHPMATQQGEELLQLWICSPLLGKGECCMCRIRQTNIQPPFYSPKSSSPLSQRREVSLLTETKSNQGEGKGETEGRASKIGRAEIKRKVQREKREWNRRRKQIVKFRRGKREKNFTVVTVMQVYCRQNSQSSYCSIGQS